MTGPAAKMRAPDEVFDMPLSSTSVAVGASPIEEHALRHQAIRYPFLKTRPP
jgi:hypothetical protein